ncbi:unnamed protein product [Clonostachys solani]|uniref:Uncharacterized protein n=1 Tax=Clonostachys solani TaxID=160281 RepID=A0A9N9ZQ12_9HYPO|nr:unnamed protein product [Clonostachys solani]
MNRIRAVSLIVQFDYVNLSAEALGIIRGWAHLWRGYSERPVGGRACKLSTDFRALGELNIVVDTGRRWRSQDYEGSTNNAGVDGWSLGTIGISSQGTENIDLEFLGMLWDGFGLRMANVKRRN